MINRSIQLRMIDIEFLCLSLQVYKNVYSGKQNNNTTVQFNCELL